VKRDTLLAVALALLAVVALGVAAATLDSAVSLGGGGFGGVEGDTPSAGDGPGDPGFSRRPAAILPSRRSRCATSSSASRRRC